MKKHLVIIISLLIGIIKTNGQEINQKWLDEINLGKKFYKAAGFDDALKHFQLASALAPFDTTAFVYIADCGLKTGHADMVESAVEKLKILKYSKPFLYEVQAATLRSIKKDYPATFNMIKEGLNVFPDNSTLLYEEILTLYQTGDYTNTLAKADVFNLKFPNHLDASKLILNIVTQKIIDNDKAAYYFARIRKNFPSDVDLLKQEVDFYLRSGTIDLAQARIEQMIAISPNDAKLYYNLGLIYYYKNDYNKSVELCQKAIELDPNFVEAHFNIGIFYFLMGIEYNKALIQMTPLQFLNQGKEAIEQATMFFEMAKPYLQKVITKKPDELDAFEALTSIEILEKNLNSLLRQIEESATPSIAENIEKPKGNPVLLINNVRFDYPNKMFGTLRKGDVGFVKFELSNTGNACAYGLSALISEPIALPGIKYNPTMGIDSLLAGQSREIEIPISYEQNSPSIRGMKKIDDVPNKLRVLIKEPNGNNSEMIEIAFKLDSDKTLSDIDDDLWETATIDFTPIPIPQNYLFIIGINKYTYWPKLGNCIKDASDVKNILTTKYQFTEKNVYELFDQNASFENLRNELIKIKNEITPYDNLVIYYAGHGYYDEEFNEGYWVPVNAHASETGEYMPTSSIYKYLTKINAKHIILIADACFSGSLFTSNSISYNENDEQTPSRWAFSSGDIEVVADGKIGTNSPFAGSLIDILSTAKKNISISQLIKIVEFNVKNTTEQTPIGRPLIMEQHKGGDFIFHIR